MSVPAPQARPPKGETRIVEPSRTERAIGRRSAEIRATVPDHELSATINIEAAEARARADGVGLTAVVISAVARALRSAPRANAAYRDGRYELYSRVNIAVMLPGPDAPTTATLFDADERSAPALDEDLRRLRERARAGQLTSPEQAGATFTVHDLSEHGIDRAVPLVIAPQAAALGLGAVARVPVADGDAVRVGHVMTLTLAADHRILFPEPAAALLSAITRALGDEPSPAAPGT